MLAEYVYLFIFYFFLLRFFGMGGAGQSVNGDVGLNMVGNTNPVGIHFLNI